MAFQTKFRSDTATNWSTTNPTLAQGEVGVDITNNIFKIGSGSTAWNSLATAPTGSPTQTLAFRSLGDGGDGNVVITSGVTTLVRDMYYNNLTISGTGQIYTNGHRVFVKGILDLTNAQAGAINFNGAAGPDAVANLGGSTPTIPSSGSIGTGGQGTSGINGTTLQGTTSTAPTAIAGNGGGTGSCGAGGTGYATYTFTVTAGNTASIGAVYTDGTYNYTVTTALTAVATSLVTIGFAIPNPTGSLTFVSGTGTGPIVYSAVAATNSGGNSGAGATGTTFSFVRGWKINLIRGVALTLGGQGGRGGASGGGDGTFIGGGGGGGGNGAGVLAVYANIILKSSSTAAGAIQSNGGNGGVGGTSGGYLGGGGGGSGGGGGWVYLAYN